MNVVRFAKKSIRYLYRETVLYAVWHFVSYFPLFPTIMYSTVRAKAWRFIGAKIGKKVRIGYGVYIDVSTLRRLTIDDYVGIGAECLILLHKGISMFLIRPVCCIIFRRKPEYVKYCH